MIAVFVVDNFNSTSDGTSITAQRYASDMARQGLLLRCLSKK